MQVCNARAPTECVQEMEGKRRKRKWTTSHTQYVMSEAMTALAKQVVLLLELCVHASVKRAH